MSSWGEKKKQSEDAPFSEDPFYDESWTKKQGVMNNVYQRISDQGICGL